MYCAAPVIIDVLANTATTFNHADIVTHCVYDKARIVTLFNYANMVTIFNYAHIQTYIQLKQSTNQRLESFCSIEAQKCTAMSMR